MKVFIFVKFFFSKIFSFSFAALNGPQFSDRQTQSEQPKTAIIHDTMKVKQS